MIEKVQRYIVSIRIPIVILKTQGKTAVSPLMMHWSYYSLALNSLNVATKLALFYF